MIETKCDGCGAIIDRRTNNTFGLYKNFVQFENEHFDFCGVCIIKVKNAMTDALPLLRERMIENFMEGLRKSK